MDALPPGPLCTQTYISLLKTCCKAMDLHNVKKLHDHIVLHKVTIDGLLGDHLTMSLARCGAVENAVKLSKALSSRSVFSWTAIISAYVESGHGQKALKLYNLMLMDGVEPSNYTLVSLLRACAGVGNLEQGKLLHFDCYSRGFNANVHVGSALLNMYTKCGSMVDAENVFIAVQNRDVVSWNTLLSAYVKQNQPDKVLRMYWQMQKDGIKPGHLTFVSVMQACGSLAEREDSCGNKSWKSVAFEIIKALHADAHQMAHCMSNMLVKNTLVSLYGKCGAIRYAEAVFFELIVRSDVSWNVMLSAYVAQGDARLCLQGYHKMQSEGISSNQMTISIALQACNILADKREDLAGTICLEITRALHVDACFKDYDTDLLICTNLLNIYGKLGCITDAEDMFVALPHRDVVAWTVMLSTYIEQEKAKEALQLYLTMHIQGMNINEMTFIAALQACCILAVKTTIVIALEIGQALHLDACLKGYTSNLQVGTAIMIMYGKCGLIDSAECIFGSMTMCDIIMWNAIFSVHIEQGLAERALCFYIEMKKQNVVMNDATLLCMFQACSEIGCLELCRELHFNATVADYSQIPSIGATLMHAYGNSGSVKDAQACFEEVLEPDAVSWAALLSGYAAQGDSIASFHTFETMVLTTTKFDDALVNLILSGCNHAGHVLEGITFSGLCWPCFKLGRSVQFYSILIDLLGRAGDFKRVEHMLKRLPVNPDRTLWMSLLGACHIHGNVELADHVYCRLISLEPGQSTAYILMSNLLAGLIE